MTLFYQINPFDLVGPVFLALYVALLFAACFLAYILRRSAAGPNLDSPARGVGLDAYEAAYLSGGAKLAAETAIATMVSGKVLQLSLVDDRLSLNSGQRRPSHPFEHEVYRLVESREATTVNGLRTKAAAAAERIGTRLKTLGLVINDDQKLRAHILPVIIMVMVLLFGVIKIIIGLSRNRPIIFLFILCAITAVIAYMLYTVPPLRTKHGDGTLELLKRENAALASTAKSKPERLATGDVALAMALFGMTSLAFTDESWSALERQMFPPTSSSSGGSSCSSSSCGSSGCGGGCGGGGCGGCGS